MAFSSVKEENLWRPWDSTPQVTETKTPDQVATDPKTSHWPAASLGSQRYEAAHVLLGHQTTKHRKDAAIETGVEKS